MTNNMTPSPEASDVQLLEMGRSLNSERVKRFLIKAAKGLRQVAAGIGVIIGAISELYGVSI